MLNAAAVLWYVVTITGQLMFAAYIAVLYGGGAARGDITVLDRVMPTGYVPGDALGNSVIISHLALALVILTAGALQLVPTIRRRAPRIHRWVGRSYLIAALMASAGGLYLIWTRGGVGDFAQHVASTLNASLIIGFAIMAWRGARAKRFAEHRRWALRLYLAASGVWFFRIGLMLWLLIFQSPVGFDPKTFEGPFLTALAFGESIVPLAMLQLFYWAEGRAGARARLAVAWSVIGVSTAMAAGIFAATMGMWLPRMR